MHRMTGRAAFGPLRAGATLLALAVSLSLSLPAEAGARPTVSGSGARATAVKPGPAGPTATPAIRATHRAFTGRVAATGLAAGAASRVITPYAYETWNDADLDATYEPPEDTFNDAGVDHLFDWQEKGALGPDGKPGKAGVDDNQNGTIDDSGEYLATGSDDVKDPAKDNYNATSNPTGTEGNGNFESVALAGFQGMMGEDIRPMQGVRDELYTRALAVSDGDETSIVIVNDLIGLLFHYLNPVKRDLERATGIPFENIIIASTHTHQGPDVVGIWAGGVDSSYMQFVMRQMYEAGLEAYSKMQSVDVRSATARPMACYDKATLVQMPLPECYLADYESANFDRASEYDQHMLQNDLRDPWVSRMEVPIMQLVAKTGATVATVVNFDDHPELLLDENPYASSDFPHYVRETLEDRLGGIAIYLSGTVGSQMGALRGTPIPYRDEDGNPEYQPGIFDGEGNPVPVWASGAENRTRSLGMVIGEYAAEAVLNAPYSVDPGVAINTSYVDVSIENPIFRVMVNKIKKSGDFHEWNYVVRGKHCSSAGCMRTPVSVLTLADATFLTAPGEFPPEYVVGREASIAPYSVTDPGYEDYHFPALPGLQQAVRTREIFFVGLGNSYFGYAIPKSDTLALTDTEHPNYYEEVYDANLCFGDAVGNRLFEMLGSSLRFSDCVAYP